MSPPTSAEEAPAASVEAHLPDVTKQALEWEKKQWVSGSVYDDEFYSVPDHGKDAPPGTVLKLERVTDTSLYALPPATALSRFLYQSKTLNGSLVPVSAYVLWPYAPRSSSDGLQVVAWSHGTSGEAPNTAPSHLVNLWQHYLAPYALALQGYVVVATDYAGLGVSKDHSGQPIVHEYLAGPAQANDVFYSVVAAREAFPELSEQFVVVGHSQGGGSAWAAAQRQAKEPVAGYLGAVAISPVTRVLSEAEPIRSLLAVGMLAGISAYYSDFKPEHVLTPEAVERYALVQAIGGNAITSITLLSDIQLLQPEWTSNPWIMKYQEMVGNGAQEIDGPLLVLHGEADPNLNCSISGEAVEATARQYPQSQIEYIKLPGITHVPAMTSSQRIWMDWIADRFQGKEAVAGSTTRVCTVSRPIDTFQPELNNYLSIAAMFYQAP